VIDGMKIDKWTGVLLRIPKREAVAQCRVQFILDVHDVKQLDPRGSHFEFQAKRRRAARACARGRAGDADHARASHARGTNVVTIAVVFLAIFWAVVALLPVWRRVFSALPPVNPVLLTLVRVYSSVG